MRQRPSQQHKARSSYSVMAAIYRRALLGLSICSFNAALIRTGLNVGDRFPRGTVQPSPKPTLRDFRSMSSQPVCSGWK